MGKEARLQKTFICDPKKYLGRKHDDEDVAALNYNSPFKVRGSSEDNDCLIEVAGRDSVGIKQVTSKIFEELKSRIERHFNRPLPNLKTVIAVPVCFEDK